MGASRAVKNFEDDENWVVSSVMWIGRALFQGRIEALDDGASNWIRAGQLWRRVDPTPHTIMTLLGPVRYERARNRRDAESASWVPVNESLGFVNSFLTRPAASLAALAVGCRPPREAAAPFARMSGMTPSVSTLQRLSGGLQGTGSVAARPRWDPIREEEVFAEEAVSAVISLDGVMVPLRAGEEGCEKAGWREAACGTIAFECRKGKRPGHQVFRPHAGNRENDPEGVAGVRAGVDSDGAPGPRRLRRRRRRLRQLELLGNPGHVRRVRRLPHARQHLRVVGEHAKAEGWYEKHAEILRTDPEGVEKVIRAILYLRDIATTGADDLARELAFFRKNRHRMR